MQDDYLFRKLALSDGELQETSALLRKVFPQARHLTVPYLAWLYRDNPDGSALGYNAYCGDELVGHCAGIPLRAALEREVASGIILLNAAVASDHRRRNITRRTTDPMFEEASGRGLKFAVSTGNRYSTKPLLTRFKMVGQLEARIGFGIPRLNERVQPASFERLWSEESFAWRLRNPQAHYCARRHGERTVVLSNTSVPGVRAILTSGARLATQLPMERGGRLNLYLGKDSGISWQGSRFVPIPSRLRPSPLNLLFKDLTGQDYVPDPRHFRFECIDFDAY